MFCEYCGKEHDGSYGSGRFCSKECKNKYAGRKAGNTLKVIHSNKSKTFITKICEKCGKEFKVENTYQKRKRRFCSRSCANGHVMSIQSKEKIRNSINKYLVENGFNLRQYEENGIKSQRLATPKILICEICGKKYEHWWHNKRHTCYNPACIHKYHSMRVKQNPNIGGYREHSGNGKGGWYKGISCQSTYELAWVIYNLDHDIKFKKCKKTFKYILEGKEHIYHPDFEVEDGIIIELKGYYQSTVSLKEKAVLAAGYKYKILYKKDLKYCFDYIKEHYGKSKENIVTLYDESKGFITKTCIICGKEFKTRNKDQKCCCRSCNGKFKKDNQINGKHMVNDVLKLHKIISDTKEQEKLLQDGWRFGATFK